MSKCDRAPRGEATLGMAPDYRGPPSPTTLHLTATDDERSGAVGRWWKEVRPEMWGEATITSRTEDEISA